LGTKERHTVINIPALKNERIACLTLDLEQDYGDLLEEPSYEGLEHIPELISFFKERSIPLTCFIQGSLLETHPAQIETLSALDIEFELHAYSHHRPKESDIELQIERGKEAYAKFFGKAPMGYRSPLGFINSNDYEILASNEFKFDSSVCPSLRPGAFNNLTKPTEPYLMSNSKIIEFPLTVFSPIIRIPVALSYIKLLGKPYVHFLRTFPLPNLIIFSFHLHDLFQLGSSSGIPFEEFSLMYKRVFRKIYSQRKPNGLQLLDEVITLLDRRGYLFSKLADVYGEAMSKREPK
jgi:peptidoglycan/xylan/chitin deacetylase (PgdA/CDA1 family)